MQMQCSERKRAGRKYMSGRDNGKDVEGGQRAAGKKDGNGVVDLMR